MISDVVGATGQQILRTIGAGEPDGKALATLKNAHIRASADDIGKSLRGTWRAEHLCALKQALNMFDFLGQQLTECDAAIERQLLSMAKHDGTLSKGPSCGRGRNTSKFDLRTQLYQVCSVD